MKLDSTIAAIVTGAASGLGEASARHLASFGVRVGVLDLNEERGMRVACAWPGGAAKVRAEKKLRRLCSADVFGKLEFGWWGIGVSSG